MGGFGGSNSDVADVALRILFYGVPQNELVIMIRVSTEKCTNLQPSSSSEGVSRCYTSRMYALEVIHAWDVCIMMRNTVLPPPSRNVKVFVAG